MSETEVVKEEIKGENLVVYDPFSINFVVQEYKNPELIAKLIEMGDTLSSEYFGPYPTDRGSDDSMSGLQTSRTNLFDLADRFPAMNEFKKMCEEMASKYFEHNSILNKPKQVYFDAWFNKLHGEGIHQAHTHGDTDVVLNFYLTTPKGYDPAGNECPSKITFLAPNHLVTALTFNENRMETTILPKPGTMLASPPWYFHYVPPTHCPKGEWRRSISVNMRVMKMGTNMPLTKVEPQPKD